MTTHPPRRLLAMVAAGCVLMSVACSGGPAGDEAGAPTTSTTATGTTPSSSTTSSTGSTTTTAPLAPLADRAFRELQGFEYAELSPDELLLFAGGVDADDSSDVIRAVDARAVGNPGEPVGVLVAYDLGPAFEDAAVWDRFAEGAAIGANSSPLDIEIDGMPATLIIDTGADTIGVLWRSDEHLGLLAIAEDGSDAFRVASERVAAG